MLPKLVSNSRAQAVGLPHQVDFYSPSVADELQEGRRPLLPSSLDHGPWGHEGEWADGGHILEVRCEHSNMGREWGGCVHSDSGSLTQAVEGEMMHRGRR